MNTLTRANDARKQTLYSQRWKYDGKIQTLREILDAMTIVKKAATTRNHEEHKRDGCYNELAKPITSYTVYSTDGVGLVVPKLVFDDFDVECEIRTNY